MDSSASTPQSFLGRLASSLKDKTIKIAESHLIKTLQSENTPDEAILGLVSSAVAAGAQRLEVRVENNDLVLTHDGRLLNINEVERLPSPVGSIAELSQALLLHLSSEGAKVILQFISPLGMHSANLIGTKSPNLSDADLNDLKLAKMTTRLYLCGTGNYRRINQAMGNELPEVLLIRRRAFLAPLEITISGKVLPTANSLPPSFLTTTSFGGTPYKTLTTIASLPELGQRVDLQHVNPHLQAVSSGLCGVAINAAESGWYQLHQGVARPLTGVAESPQTWGYLVLRDDAKGEALATDIALLSSQMLNALYQGITTSIHSTISSTTNDILAYLEKERQTLIALGHNAVDLDQTFLSLRANSAPSSDPKLLNNRLDLATSLEMAGRLEESKEQYAQVLPIWESEALNHFDKYRYSEGAALWQKALQLHEKLGTDPNEIAAKYLKLAKIGKDQRLGFAEQSYRRALQILRSLSPHNRTHELEALLGLAEVLKKNRVLTESLHFAEDAEKLQIELCGGKETKDLVPLLKLQAEIYGLLDDYAHSTELEQRALLLKFRR